MMGFGFLFFLLLIGLLILGLGRGFGGLFTGHGYGGHHGPHAYSTPRPAGSPAPEDPKRLLQLRYARGEITREEYLQMLKDLEGFPR